MNKRSNVRTRGCLRAELWLIFAYLSFFLLLMHEQALYFESVGLWLLFAQLSLLLLVMHERALQFESSGLWLIFAQPFFLAVADA